MVQFIDTLLYYLYAIIIIMNSLKLFTWNATGLISSSSYLCDSLRNHDIDFCGLSEHYLFPQNVRFIDSLISDYRTHVVCDRDLLKSK